MKLETEKEEPADISEGDATKWKALIMDVDDPKVLNYIRELIYARESIGRADNILDPEPTKHHNEVGESVSPCACSPYSSNTPKKFKPVSIKYEDHEAI